MSERVVVRPVVPADLPFLWDMAWEATAVSPEMRVLGRDVALQRPEVRKYLEDWGRAGDAGVIALDGDGQPLGAAWFRFFPADSPGYGFVAPDVPELSIGVHERARGQGVGRVLLVALLQLARQHGFAALSLSVDRQNPARRLYERVGFHDAGISPDEDSSVTMVVRFGSA
jgi:ribosomal protein S18 acetylase RimI-like enzyme